ncbi:hypothetical protein K9M79_01670 [Candidatus Woesearchaeota archaeon]|nr:hypothetical protein [Candidatus Woesearchaeota archaeon]
MSIFDKIQFWKKDDDPFSSGLDTGLENNPVESFNSGISSSSHRSMGNQPDLGLPEMGQGLPDMDSHESGERFDAPFNPATVRNVPNQQSTQTSSLQGDQLISKEIEILSTKIDVLRAGIENINQRLVVIEDLIKNDKKKW